MLRREFVSIEEWKAYMPVLRYMIPVVFYSGVVMHLLGNWDPFYMIYHFIIGIIFIRYYTKRKGTYKKKKERTGIKKGIRIMVEVCLVAIIIFQMYDTFRYTIAMVQIQYHNEGYVRVTSIHSGELGEPGMYANEYDTREDKVYQHVFKGYKYLSKVDITEDIKREMKKVGG